jgi:D-alanyl-D-alanine carboxypeptidase
VKLTGKPFFIVALVCLFGNSQGAGKATGNEAWNVRQLTQSERKGMTPVVWREGCPVSLDDINRITVKYRTYDRQEKIGHIDVNSAVANDVVQIFRDLFNNDFLINSVTPIEAYGGSDERSIDDDNTSAFNCRPVTGGKRFSQHAYGNAIDLNPYRNPYVVNGKAAKQRKGIGKYVKRDRKVVGVGVIFEDGPAVAAFSQRGWKWGGNWKNPIDYQHFSVNGK